MMLPVGPIAVVLTAAAASVPNRFLTALESLAAIGHFRAVWSAASRN